MVMFDSKVYRIRTSNLKVYEQNGNSWKQSKQPFPDATHVAALFKAHRNLKLITDPKDSRFLIGAYSNGKTTGGRISVLPDGTPLTKAYSLFAKHLRIHDEQSHVHWDVLFQNPSGSYTYVYTKDKTRASKQKKFSSVAEFERLLPKLTRNLQVSLGDDPMALPMILLLKTKMRVGSEVYYKKNHHKGLTTLKKKNLRVNRNNVTFRYLAKDGVPMTVTEVFSTKVVGELTKLLKKKKAEEFIFTGPKGHPLKDTAFEKTFQRYTGKKFYPHIVRSHYATMEAKKFFKKHTRVTPEEVRNLYRSIAEKLGHKKFSKKKGEWEDSYQVTLQYYVQEEIAEKIAKMVSKP